MKTYIRKHLNKLDNTLYLIKLTQIEKWIF